MINQPKVLLLDEPFGALDAFTRVSLQDRMIELWRQFGYTAIMVTHDVEEAVVLATKIVVMSDRPATVEKIFDNHFEYPRDRNANEILERKKEILSVLHLNSEL